MEHRIGKRWLLVSLLAGAQLVCLLAALAGFSGWMTHHLRQTVRERVVAATRQNADQIAELIAMMEIGDVSPGSPGLAKLQQIAERTRLPEGGYLCIISDEDGRLLCHPNLANDATLADARLPQATTNARGKDAHRYFELDGPSGSELVMVRNLPGLDAKLLVHHNVAAIDASVDQFIARARNMGLLVAAMLTLLTALLSMLIVRRYEARLINANEKLSDANAKLGIANAALADVNIHLEEKVAKRSASLVRSREAVIYGMAKLAESRDGDTGKHLERICRYVEILGSRIVSQSDGKLNKRWLDTITSTAALHDIGKVGIPDDVLLKTGKLDEDERRIIEKHTTIGGDALLALERQWTDDGASQSNGHSFLATAAQIALGHHEKWDGSGYPFGLEGDGIPLPARLVAVADVYDALTTKRVYKDAMSHHEAKQVIISGRGKHFDPQMVDLFEDAADEFEQVLREMGDAR